MERPAKRPRLSLPAQLLDDRDIEEARARNDLRLKTLFEGIFEKYGRDFSDIGDEIDLQTGEIVVNNGHVVGMRRVNDLGGRSDASLTIKSPTSPTRLDSPEVLEAFVGTSERDNQTPSITNAALQNTMLDSPKTRGAESASDDRWRTHCKRSSLASDMADDCKGYSEKTRGLPARHENTFILNQSKATAAAPQETIAIPADSYKEDRPIEPLWQVPDVDTKFTTPKQNKPVLNSQAAVASIRSASPPSAEGLSPRQGNGFVLNQSEATAAVPQVTIVIPNGSYKGMPIDPRWQLPDVDAGFTTPEREKPMVNSLAAVTSVRSASPPNAEPPWSLPATLDRKANTDVRKKTIQAVHHRRKRKQPLLRDWSFAMLQDGSDSDDPLQEDLQRSPTPCYILKPLASSECLLKSELAYSSWRSTSPSQVN
jgi:centromere protein Scm3